MSSPETDVWLILEDWDRAKERGSFWLFEGRYEATLRVLQNMHRIEFYIADRNMTWIVCENHHDLLIGSGEYIVNKLRALSAA